MPGHARARRAPERAALLRRVADRLEHERERIGALESRDAGKTLEEGTALAAEDAPAEAVLACSRQLASALRESGWVDGCPVTAAALETLGTDSEIQRTCAAALHDWTRLVGEKLLGAGFDPVTAGELATTVISTLERAEVTAQVNRSEEPLLAAGRQLARLVRSYEGHPGS
ncbi:TetR/AcrR family transcriptional regulator [Streptomyces lavendulae]|uniref:LmrA/YxaF family transcription factor n=1 Tax=Streptomyces lavendulae TaxID=1914 RepID=UPI0033292120